MRRLLLAILATLLLGGTFGAPAASAAFNLEGLDVTFENEDGSVDTQAGSHPFAMTTTVGVGTVNTPRGEVPDGEIRDLTVTQIPGFVGNQTAVPTCSMADFNNKVKGFPQCPNDSAVGYIGAEVEFEVIPPEEKGLLFYVPVYNLTPPPGVPAELGFVVLNVPITIDVGVNEAPPYNLVAHLHNVPQALLFYRSKLTLWGNPESPAHDSLRGTCLGNGFEAIPTSEPVSRGECPVSAGETAFLTLPRACEGPLATGFSSTSWRGELAGEAVPTHNGSEPPEPQGMTGCERLSFHPQISAQTTASSADSATGLDFEINIEDQGLTSPSGYAQSDLKKIVTTLPEGVTVNPSAAEGLGVCTLAQYEAESLTSVPGQGCPEDAKLGTVSIKSPLVEEALEGSLFLAQQTANPFHSLLALYLVIKSPQYGILIKQAGKVEPDPSTGQLLTTFEGIPQLPFSRLKLHFREGPRSPLVTPQTCGTYTTKAVLTPWSGGAPVTETATFRVTSGPGGGPCPSGGAPFAPGFSAGSVNNAAGAFSPFVMRLTRGDGEQELTRFDAVLPPGVVGKLAGVAKCPEAGIAQAQSRKNPGEGALELALPSCPAASQVGRTLAGAGVGSSLTYVPGKLYLAGPFGGDPLSVVAITPVLAGPFDAGVVVVREALTLNPETAEVEVDGAHSDPIPHILQGIPLDLRDLRVIADRPEFTLNPTSCEPERARATLFGAGANLFSSADDTPTALSTRYQAASCAHLDFHPQLSLRLSGATRRGGNPALRAEVKARRADANIGAATVILPHSAFLEQAHIGTICTRPQFAEHKCPAKSVYGHARAFTPLLDEPLEGPVYLRANGGERELPDLVAALHGVVDINLVGYIDATHARIRSRFLHVPDAPISRFVLSMAGGKKSLIANSADLCERKHRATARFTGQNGKLLLMHPVVKASCSKHKKPKS